MNYKASIIMPVYNGEKYLKEAIDSVLEQDYESFELIVVDDGSKDNSKELIKEYCDKVIYIYKNNGGTPSAYNLGISAATGRYIAFIEQDDIWMPKKLSQQIEFLDKHTSFGMVYSPVYLLREEITSKQSDINHQDMEGEYGFKEFFIKNRILNCSSVLLKREAIQKAGMFRTDLKLAFDYDLWLRVSAHFKIRNLGVPMVKYRIHEDNLSKDDDELAAAEGQLYSLLHWISDKEKINEVGREKFMDRILESYHRVAWDHALNNNRKSELDYLLKAVKTCPMNLQAWKKYAWRSLTPNIRKRLTWYSGRINKIILRKHR